MSPTIRPSDAKSADRNNTKGYTIIPMKITLVQPLTGLFQTLGFPINSSPWGHMCVPLAWQAASWVPEPWTCPETVLLPPPTLFPANPVWPCLLAQPPLLHLSRAFSGSSLGLGEAARGGGQQQFKYRFRAAQGSSQTTMGTTWLSPLFFIYK